MVPSTSTTSLTLSASSRRLRSPLGPPFLLVLLLLLILPHCSISPSFNDRVLFFLDRVSCNCERCNPEAYKAPRAKRSADMVLEQL